MFIESLGAHGSANVFSMLRRLSLPPAVDAAKYGTLLSVLFDTSLNIEIAESFGDCFNSQCLDIFKRKGDSSLSRYQMNGFISCDSCTHQSIGLTQSSLVHQNVN